MAISGLTAAALTFAFGSHYVAPFSAACGNAPTFLDGSLAWLGGQAELRIEYISQALSQTRLA